jgi:hypothetical protein
MTSTDTTRMSTGTRRTGYAVALVVNAALLIAVNIWPGWRLLPLLTEDFVQVSDLVNLSLVAAIAANLVYLVGDRPVVRAVGEVITTAIGLVVVVRVFQVFPFAFAGPGFGWAFLVRVLLVLGVVGTSIALLVAIGSVLRALARV